MKRKRRKNKEIGEKKNTKKPNGTYRASVTVNSKGPHKSPRQEGKTKVNKPAMDQHEDLQTVVEQPSVALRPKHMVELLEDGPEVAFLPGKKRTESEREMGNKKTT